MTTDKLSSRNQLPTEAETYALGLLAEEAGEVLQLVGKALRFGVDTPGRLGPDGKVTGETPRTLLPAEVGDLLAAVAFAIGHDLLDGREVYEAKKRKLAKLLNPRAVDNLGRPLAPQPDRDPGLFAPRQLPFAEAQAVADDPRVLGVYLAPEWDELDHDGHAWVAAIVAVARPDAGEQHWRHVTRGSDYVEVGRAKVQNSLQLIDEGDTVVVYRGTDGKLWVRHEDEFEDGRFVRLEAR